MRGIAIDVPGDSIPHEYVGLRDQLSPTDKGKGKARQLLAQVGSASNLRDVDVTSTTSATPQKRRREAGDADDEEQAAYEARLKTYDPAAPRVSSFLSGPPLAPEPGVSRRMPPQDYRAPRLDASNSTGSEVAPIPTDLHHQHTDATNPTMTTPAESRTDNDLRSAVGDRENLALPLMRGPFDHMNLSGEPNSTDVPRSTPWFPSRVRPFDYLTTAGSSQDTGPIQQPTYQQTVHSSGGLASFPTFASNTPFSEPTFPSLNISHGLPHSSLHPAGEDSSFPTSASSLLSPHPPIGWENPPLDHRTPSEPRYPHVYVTFGAGVLQKEIDMHTADNPVEAKESVNGTVDLIPYHIPT